MQGLLLTHIDDDLICFCFFVFKRSIDGQEGMIPIVLSNIQRQFEEADVQEMECRQRLICESASWNNNKENSFAYTLSTFFG